MPKSQIGLFVLLGAFVFAIGGCSRVAEDWKAAQTSDTTEAYQDFLRQHPDSEYGVAAQERVRQLAEERDWQQASKADTLDAYQQFVAVHADGKWAQEARTRIENFQLSAGTAPLAPPAVPGSEAGSAADAAAPATAVPVVAPPKPAATAQHPAPVARDSARPEAGARHYAQLGAYSSKASAESAWHRLSARFPAQFNSLQPHYATAADSRHLVRLQVALPSADQVHGLCAELKRQSQACLPI